MLIVSFWKVVSLNIGSINFIVKKVFLCTFRTFRILLPLEGGSWSVTRVVILLLILTAAVAIPIVICVIAVFSSGLLQGLIV